MTSWTVLTINAAGHRLPQPARNFDEAWALAAPGPRMQALASPPADPNWTIQPKHIIQAYLNTETRHVCVATHRDGSSRHILKS
jgi:hypothetical protein